MARLLQVLLAGFVLVVGGCKQGDGNVLKVGANNWLGYQPLFVAQAFDLYDKNEINVVELGSATAVLRALHNGGVDVAAVTLDEAMGAIAQGKKIKVLAVADFSHGGDALLVNREIQTLADLKGKRLGVENTALGAIMLDVVLGKAQLALSDVQVTSATYDEHDDFLQDGKGEALITFEPVRSKLLSQGYREIFNSKEIPGTIIDVLVVREQVLKKYPRQINSLLKGFFKARDLIVDGDSESIANISKRIGLSREAVLMGYEQLKLPSLEENQVLMNQCINGFGGTVYKLNTIMVNRKMIDEMVDFTSACEISVIRELSL